MQFDAVAPVAKHARPGICSQVERDCFPPPPAPEKPGRQQSSCRSIMLLFRCKSHKCCLSLALFEVLGFAFLSALRCLSRNLRELKSRAAEISSTCSRDDDSQRHQKRRRRRYCTQTVHSPHVVGGASASAAAAAAKTEPKTEAGARETAAGLSWIRRADLHWRESPSEDLRFALRWRHLPLVRSLVRSLPSADARRSL